MANKNNKSLLEFDVSLKGVSLEEKALFSKHLAVMLRAGMPVLEALQISRTSTEGKLKKIIIKVESSVASGHSLSDSFAEYPNVFSKLFINVTKAGESSGTLIENLENLAEGLQKEKILLGKVKGALLYPVIVLIATFGLGMVLSFVVLPKITPLFDGLQMDLPTSTKFLIAFSDIIQQHGALLFWGIIISVTFFLWIVRRAFMRPVTHWLMLNIPILRDLIRYSNLARFSRTLGMLLKSGVNIDEALDITRTTVGNFYFQRALNAVNLRVSRGVKLADALAEYKDLFPLLFVRMIHVGEESGNFEEGLFYLSELYEDEVDTSTKSLSTALEPALLIFIGLVVGFLALSIITPIYNVTGNIQR